MALGPDFGISSYDLNAQTVSADFNNGPQMKLLGLENQIGFRKPHFNCIVRKLCTVLKWSNLHIISEFLTMGHIKSARKATAQ